MTWTTTEQVIKKLNEIEINVITVLEKADDFMMTCRTPRGNLVVLSHLPYDDCDDEYFYSLEFANNPTINAAKDFNYIVEVLKNYIK